MALINHHIPDELWEKVFLPQPVKSLVQWKCVCKSWNRIITSKSFIKAYGAHQKISEHTRSYLLLYYCDPFNCNNFYTRRKFRIRHDDSYYSAGLVDRKSYDILEYYDNINIRNWDGGCLEVYGICDGLLCLSVHDEILGHNYPIFLYNPFIRKRKVISPRPGYKCNCGRRYASLCFGYDDDDYKVIKVHTFQDLYEIYVYSLNTDSWKFIKIEADIEGTRPDPNPKSFNIWPYPKARLVNSVAYFIQGKEIILFYLDREIIRKKQLPEDMSSAAHVIMEEYEESIALIGSTSREINVVYNDVAIGCGVAMWILRQSDNSYIWEKKFGMKFGEYNEMILHWPVLYPSVQAMGGFVNKNELVMRRWNTCAGKYIDREYFVYNVETGCEKQFQRPCEANGGFLQRINVLTESLVLLSESAMPPFPPLEVANALLGCESCDNNVRLYFH